MYVLGLTGSIGMGKTTAARAFRRLGVAVHDADAEVHALLAGGRGVAAEVARAFPGAVVTGRIDRRALGRLVFGRAEALRGLEAILHPAVRMARRRFLAAAARRGAGLVVLDVPLLFETGTDAACDAVAVVSAPGRVQRARVLRRPGMTEGRLRDVLARQMSDAEKRRRAEFVIPTGLGREVSFRAVRAVARAVADRPGTVWSPRRSRA